MFKCIIKVLIIYESISFAFTTHGTQISLINDILSDSFNIKSYKTSNKNAVSPKVKRDKSMPIKSKVTHLKSSKEINDEFYTEYPKFHSTLYDERLKELENKLDALEKEIIKLQKEDDNEQSPDLFELQSNDSKDTNDLKTGSALNLKKANSSPEHTRRSGSNNFTLFKSKLDLSPFESPSKWQRVPKKIKEDPDIYLSRFKNVYQQRFRPNYVRYRSKPYFPNFAKQRLYKTNQTYQNYVQYQQNYVNRERYNYYEKPYAYIYPNTKIMYNVRYMG